MAHFREAWASSKWATNIITKGVTWRWISPPPVRNFFIQKRTPELVEYVNKLVSLNAVEKARRISFQGRLFSVPKKDSEERRIILDVSQLNTFIHCPTFKMTKVAQVCETVPMRAYTVSLDLKDAYMHVPIAKSLRKFLGFRLGEESYMFRALPFGLNIAPRIFTKLGNVVLNQLREEGIQLLLYLDDCLIWAETPEACIIARDRVMSVFIARGFIVNLIKCRLHPAQFFVWLGLQWNTAEATLSLPSAKVSSIRMKLTSLANQTQISRRHLERIVGLLNFASVVSPLLNVYTKLLNQYLRSCARPSRRDKLFSLPIALKRKLLMLASSPILETVTPMRRGNETHMMVTDASRHGWGAHMDGRMTQGQWPQRFQSFHINVLELIAVLWGLKHFLPPTNAFIKVLSDNMSTVRCIKRSGSAASKALNEWMLAIAILCRERQWSLTATHIAGKDNVLADALSRGSPIGTEWSLDRRTFNRILSLRPAPEIDLFATEQNHQLPLYASPIPDQNAVGRDALSLDWNTWQTIYLFPPTSIMAKVLQKLEGFRGTAYLVAPRWPNRPWFPALQRLSKQCIPLGTTLIQQVGDKKFFDSSSLSPHLHVWTFC